MVNRLIKSSLCLLLFSFAAFGQPNKLLYPGEPQWVLIDPPGEEMFYYIKMFSSSSGVMGGTKLYEYDGEKWLPSKVQLIIGDVERAVVFSRSNIRVSRINNTYRPEVFYFNGFNWNRMNTPFANQINIFNINEKGIGWYGGFKEIAYYDGINWTFVKYPGGNNGYIKNIFGNEKNLWLQTDDKKLYNYNSGLWKQYFKNSRVICIDFKDVNNGYVVIDSSLYSLVNGKFKYHSTFASLNYVLKIYVISDDLMWGAGLNGTIVKFDGGKWSTQNSPVKENLLDIQMLSPKEGWIVGTNGTIFKYSVSKNTIKTKDKFSLLTLRPLKTNAPMNDEYGAAIDDIDNDGLKDIYAVCLYKPNHFFRNVISLNSDLRELSFTEEASGRGTAGMIGKTNKISVNKTQTGIALADVDNDGDKDIYITSLSGKNVLLLNNGDGYFRDVSGKEKRASEDLGRSNSACFGDIDNDGDLDLFVANEDSSNILFLNDGNGYFKDATARVCLSSSGGGMGSAFADVDNDGDLDLFVANWANQNNLYLNHLIPQGKLKFSDVTTIAKVGGEEFSKSNAALFFDYDNDGLLDLFVTNRRNSNRLYKNIGGGIFNDVTGSVFPFDTLYSYAACSNDFDNDGFTDLFISNIGENIFYKNHRGKYFAEVESPKTGMSNEYNTGAAAGDIDNDGDVDLYSSTYINGESKVYLNLTDNKNFVIVNLNGTISNRDAVGAKVWLYDAGYSGNKKYLRGFREVSSGEGYLSHSSLEIHFGTGNKRLFDIIVLFPKSGIAKKLFNIKSGTRISIAEEVGLHKIYSNLNRYLYNTLTDQENKSVIIESLIAIIITIFSFRISKRRYIKKAVSRIVVYASGMVLFLVLLFSFEFDGLFLATILPLLTLVVYLSMYHLISERILISERVTIEKNSARDRIARDLHDDLAGTISSGVIYTEALERIIAPSLPSTLELITKIKKLLAEASNSIVDVVWMASPSNDKLKNLVFRIRLLVTESCKANKLNYSVKIEENLPELYINEEVKRNLFLTFKEVMNNIIKHAGAKNVNLRVKFYDNKILEICIEDDGKGFNMLETSLHSMEYQSLHGNGLKNIQKRASEIDAVLQIISSPGRGTVISVKFKMT